MLFPLTVEEDDIPQISGLSYRPNYIDEMEETRLVRLIDIEAWDTTWERRRQLYGAAYGSDDANHARPIPDWGLELVARLHADGTTPAPFDQMLVNEYLPGQGIALHRDYEPFDRTVVSLSLLAPCVMDFRRVVDGRRESLLLEARSLLVLSDEARYNWEHGIARRKSDIWREFKVHRERRLSITFRLRKRGERLDA